MIEKQITRQIPQPVFEMRQVDRLHRLRINARPHGVRVTSSFLFVHDNGTRLTRQAKLFLDALSRIEKVLFTGNMISENINCLHWVALEIAWVSKRASCKLSAINPFNSNNET